MPPSIRASFFHSNLEALAALGRPVEANVRARLGLAVLEEIEDAARVAWLPIEHDVALTEAIEAEVGRAGMRAWARDGVLRATESPLLGPIARSVRAIFGLTPHAFLRRAPQIWTLCFRDCGALEYSGSDPKSASVELFGAPSAMLRSQPYLEGLAAGLEAGIALGGERGTVEVVMAPGARSARFDCRW